MEYDKAKLEWLEFDLLKDLPGVAHAVFQRHGGTSAGPFATLNVSDSVGDEPNSVKVNRDLIRRTLNADHIIFPHQQHGTNVVRITQANLHKTHQADVLFTTEKKIALAVAHADCQGVLFFDPVHHAVAVAHVGWRGNVQNLLSSVVEALKTTLHTNPKDLLVCVSPSLGPDHAEFKNYKTEFPKDFWSFQKDPHFFDLWAITASQLSACGIPEKNIEFARVCTACASEDYFSYRNEKKTGRNATVIALV